MSPNVSTGTVVIIAEDDRMLHSRPTHSVDTNNAMGASSGEIIVYRRGGDGPNIIHRTVFWVDEGENWYHKADSEYLSGEDSCAELQNCPAPHGGFITKGDGNPEYDQAIGYSPPVKPEWITGQPVITLPVYTQLNFTHDEETGASAAHIPSIGWVDTPTVLIASFLGLHLLLTLLSVLWSKVTER